MSVWGKIAQLFTHPKEDHVIRRHTLSDERWLDQEERRQLQEVAERLERVERQLERIKGEP